MTSRISRLRIALCSLVILVVFVIAITHAAQVPTGNIYTAIRNNDLQAIRTLSAGKNIEQVDDRGRTPLMVAASIGSLESMQILISAGANVNAVDSFGVTPLMLGIRDIAKTRLLIAAGAKPNDRTKQGQTALVLAASTAGAIETVQLLVRSGADPKVIGSGDRNGLIVAATANDLDLVRFFLDQGVKVNSVDKTDMSGHTALMAASAQNNIAMVRLLLQRGADPNMAATDAGTVKNGTLAFTGKTALMMAASYGSPELILALLDAHADVNARDVAGMTPLVFAVSSENQDPAVVKLLLSAGATAAAKTITGETALDWTRKFGAPDVVKLLNAGTVKAAPPASKREAIPMPSATELRSMIQASTALLLRSSTQVAVSGGCVNCHHQNFTGLAVAAVRAKSIPMDEPAAYEQRQAMITSLRGRENTFAQRTDSGGGLDSALNTLSALHAADYPADAMTDAVVVYMLSRQFTDGRWPREEVSRAPIQDGDINRAAAAVSLLQAYAPPSLKTEVNEHIGRARQWLLRAQPKTTDDKAMLLLGLKRAGAPQSNVQAAGKAVLDIQNADGGWGGNKNLESDAYATSEALAALLDAGIVAANSTAYQRGVRFLVETRASDGSWHVRSRAQKFQPYFESGFPYGHDQWISVAATARAVVALSRSLP